MTVELFMAQEAPFPTILANLVKRLVYRPGWTFSLEFMDRGQGSKGLTLDILTSGFNAYHPDQGQNYRVHHYMLVPPAAYNEESWKNWLFEQLLLVERHECMEFFTLVLHGEFTKRDGSTSDTHTERPYAPHHGPGNDPYLVFHHGTAQDVRTNFKGEVKE